MNFDVIIHLKKFGVKKDPIDFIWGTNDFIWVKKGLFWGTKEFILIIR